MAHQSGRLRKDPVHKLKSKFDFLSHEWTWALERTRDKRQLNISQLHTPVIEQPTVCRTVAGD